MQRAAGFERDAGKIDHGGIAGGLIASGGVVSIMAVIRLQIRAKKGWFSPKFVMPRAAVRASY
jgi:hypothetical protein